MAILTVFSDLRTHHWMPSKRVPNKVKSCWGRPTKQFFSTLSLISNRFILWYSESQENSASHDIFFIILSPFPEWLHTSVSSRNPRFFPHWLVDAVLIQRVWRSEKYHLSSPRFRVVQTWGEIYFQSHVGFAWNLAGQFIAILQTHWSQRGCRTCWESFSQILLVMCNTFYHVSFTAIEKRCGVCANEQ